MKTVCCNICKKEIVLSNFNRHYNSKHLNKKIKYKNYNRKEKRIECEICNNTILEGFFNAHLKMHEKQNKTQENKNYIIKDGKYVCKFCKYETTKDGIGNHIRYNHLGFKKIISSDKNYSIWNKGLTKETDERVDNSAKKISISLQKASKEGRLTGKASTPEKEQEKIEKIRKKINEKYANGWEAICGRTKKYEYESPIAGKIKVDGTWELKVAQYLDTLNVIWTRNKKRFDYINLENKKSTYCPDFFVFDWNSFIEVKGYETELDHCKWRQFNQNLIIWREKDLKEKNIL